MKTKTRGRRRKCDQMVREIVESTEKFPMPHPGEQYWHLHVFWHGLLDSTRVQRQCAQLMLERAQRLGTLAPENEMRARVVVIFTIPNFASSQICIFYNEEAFRSFFERNSKTYGWRRLREERSLTRKWSINIPDTFLEEGFAVELLDEDERAKKEVWLYQALIDW
jgi:hypothetical protein